MSAIHEPVPWRIRVRLVVAVIAAISVTGCAIQLAPNYEEPIVAGLNSWNAAILEQMARVSNGAPKGLTPAEKDHYAELQGKGEALLMLVEARPEPEPAFLRYFGVSTANQIGKDGNAAKVAILDTPTNEQIQGILKQLAQMEKEQREQGLAPGQYELYQSAIAVYMRNALTYEMALKR
jgi:hypothetical protein